jgi:dynein heavy chain 2
VGEKLVDVTDNFKLVLATRNPSIDLPYHQSDLVSVINFSVTRSGLQGKLLSLIITHFQPEIEQEKIKLLQVQEKLKINLTELEERLLKELADATGNILENRELLRSLN